jgi:hypothetical protein
MHHIIRFDRFQALNNLSDDDAGLLLRQSTSPHFEVVFKVTSVTKLELQVKRAFSFCHVEQGYD